MQKNESNEITKTKKRDLTIDLDQIIENGKKNKIKSEYEKIYGKPERPKELKEVYEGNLKPVPSENDNSNNTSNNEWFSWN